MPAPLAQLWQDFQQGLRCGSRRSEAAPAAVRAREACPRGVGPDGARRTSGARAPRCSGHARRGQRPTKHRRRAERKVARATVTAEIGRLNAVLPVLRERVAVRRVLYEKEYGSKLTWLEVRITVTVD